MIVLIKFKRAKANAKKKHAKASLLSLNDQFARQLRLEKAILLVLVVMSQSQRQSQRLTQPKTNRQKPTTLKKIPPAKTFFSQAAAAKRQSRFH